MRMMQGVPHVTASLVPAPALQRHSCCAFEEKEGLAVLRVLRGSWGEDGGALGMGRGCSKGGESLEAGGAGPLGPQGRQPPSLQDDGAHNPGLGTTTVRALS